MAQGGVEDGVRVAGLRRQLDSFFFPPHGCWGLGLVTRHDVQLLRNAIYPVRHCLSAEYLRCFRQAPSSSLPWAQERVLLATVRFPQRDCACLQQVGR